MSRSGRAKASARAYKRDGARPRRASIVLSCILTRRCHVSKLSEMQQGNTQILHERRTARTNERMFSAGPSCRPRFARQTHARMARKVNERVDAVNAPFSFRLNLHLLPFPPLFFLTNTTYQCPTASPLPCLPAPSQNAFTYT